MRTCESRRWRPAAPVDVAFSLSVHRRGRGDPAYRRTPDGAVWRAVRTPAGPGTLRVCAAPSTAEVTAQAWGAGAQWLLDRLPAMLGADDDLAGFTPVHPPVRDAALRRSGFRVGRTERVLEALVPAILEQKVTGMEAHRSWRELLRRFGTPAPGPAETVQWMRVPPQPSAWVELPSWEWHRAGVDPRRARTIRVAASAANRLEETVALGGEVAARRLRSLPGVGQWTVAEVRQRAHGDADAVSVGDLHVPGIIGWALAGEVVDDDGMLALLEPYAGHRYRVQRLLETPGVGPPRRAPRFAPRDYRAL
ncbi:MAG: DNA-3-methyladenine glycosylase 2 family protein [Streptosporangiales bacterium]|nr:DNA-3-methyladenine glycosylase 2 family protein [Streptosporangiales bacterium]